MAFETTATMKGRAAHFQGAVESFFQAPRFAGVRHAGAQGAAIVRRRPYVAGALGLLLLALVGYLAYSSTSSSADQYVTAPVVKGDIEDNVTALGNLQPRDYVDVGAQATGQLKKLYVNIGDTVKQGQLLAEIDPQEQNAKVAEDQANVANLQAQLLDKQAQFALATTNYSRQKRLMAASATDKADYDSALQAMNSAAAEVGALKAQIASSQSTLSGDQVTLGYTKIYAPMSGTVASLSIKQGQTINSVQQAPTLLRIADLSIMTVWTQVSEADVPKLHVGMPAYFTTLGNPDKRWTGKLQQIQPTPTVVNNVVLYTATFDVSNPDNQLMTQMTAQVFFVTASAHDVVTVPVSALHQRHGRAGGRTKPGSPNPGQNPAAQSARGTGTPVAGVDIAALRAAMKVPGAKRYTVQVMGSDGTVQSRPIVVGVSNRVSAQVLAGLSIGEQVVVGMKDPSAVPAASHSASTSRNGTYGAPSVGMP
jgi:membrane fusion protein, macrolide-specific efflux system